MEKNMEITICSIVGLKRDNGIEKTETTTMGFRVGGPDTIIWMAFGT